MNSVSRKPIALMERHELIAEIDRLDRLINTPSVDSFLESVKLESAHQVERWGEAVDRQKEPGEWFWLIGYLAGKALAAAIRGDAAKAKHHTISAAAALSQWHKVL